ncbi:hypothetical protein, partial [Rubritalea sp.]|uniref:hypothetical protein n=1 Tax=Rubritalea sp. TaxID=2109375 RepID=UPI003EF4B049
LHYTQTLNSHTKLSGRVFGWCALRSTKMAQSSRYITTEIIIKSDSKCDALVAELVNDDVGFYIQASHDIGKWYLCIDPIPMKTVNLTLQLLCSSIENLSSEARGDWDSALYREFYIGYEVSPKDHCVIERISQESVGLCSKICAGIGIAMYPRNSEN